MCLHEEPNHLLFTLCRELRKEQKEYVEELLSQPPKCILNHAYEYVIREQIKSCVCMDILNRRQMQALLNVDRPLDTIYRYIASRELTAIDDIVEGIIGAANNCIKLMLIDEAIKLIEEATEDPI